MSTTAQRAATGEAPRIADLPAASIAPGLLSEVLSGALSGVLARWVATPAQCEALINRLEASPLEALDAAPFPGVTYGAVLVVSDSDLVRYRREGAALDAALAGEPVVDALRATLERLAAPAAVGVPEGFHGLTVRVLSPPQAVAVHSERHEWPSMRELHRAVDFSTQLSFYLTLRAPASGGELVVYHRPPPGREPRMEGVSPARAHAALAAFGQTRLHPGVGDLLIFNGGRFNHRVTPVRGGERWTLGGFASPGRAPGTLLTWS